MTIAPITFGEMITDELDARKWSLADVAERTGVSKEEWREIFDGERRMLVSEAERLARALNVNISTLMTLQRNLWQGGET